MVLRVPRTAFQYSKAIFNLLFLIRFTGLRINIEHFCLWKDCAKLEGADGNWDRKKLKLR